MSSMRPWSYYGIEGNVEFFRLALSHNNLVAYFKVNFALMQHHKYSLTELDNMMPWEREVYVAMLTEHIKEENERQKQIAAKQRR